jgi:hypothetical protein
VNFTATPTRNGHAGRPGLLSREPSFMMRPFLAAGRGVTAAVARVEAGAFPVSGDRFAPWVCAGQGSDDPFFPGRRGPAGPLRLPLVLLRGVARCDQHPCDTHETHTMALADGAGRA